MSNSVNSFDRYPYLKHSTAPDYAAQPTREPVRHGAVTVAGALVICENFDREPCPHNPARRCGDCPGGHAIESAVLAALTHPSDASIPGARIDTKETP